MINELVVEPGIITEIVLNRPEKRNAMTAPMWKALLQALRDADQDDEVRVVILRGNGPVFCAGQDLVEQTTGKGPSSNAIMYGSRPVREAIWELSKPVIAAVQGYLGPGAVHIINVCDLAVAAEGAVFSYQINRVGGVQHVSITTPVMGHKRLKEWQLMGGVLSAEEAQQYGPINKVVPMDELYKQARAWAQTLVNVSPQGLYANKLLINQVYELAGFSTLNLLASALRYFSQGGADRDNFHELVREKGVKRALDYRDKPFEETEKTKKTK